MREKQEACWFLMLHLLSQNLAHGSTCSRGLVLQQSSCFIIAALWAGGEDRVLHWYSLQQLGTSKHKTELTPAEVDSLPGI